MQKRKWHFGTWHYCVSSSSISGWLEQLVKARPTMAPNTLKQTFFIPYLI